MSKPPPTCWIVSNRGKESLETACELQDNYRLGKNESLVYDAADYDALRAELSALRALVLASRPALEAGEGALLHAASLGASAPAKKRAQIALEHAAQLRTLSAYGVGK